MMKVHHWTGILNTTIDARLCLGDFDDLTKLFVSRPLANVPFFTNGIAAILYIATDSTSGLPPVRISARTMKFGKRFNLATS